MRPDTWSRRLKAEMERLAAAHPDLPQLTAHELRHTYGTSLRRHMQKAYMPREAPRLSGMNADEA